MMWPWWCKGHWWILITARSGSSGSTSGSWRLEMEATGAGSDRRQGSSVLAVALGRSNLPDDEAAEEDLVWSPVAEDGRGATWGWRMQAATPEQAEAAPGRSTAAGRLDGRPVKGARRQGEEKRSWRRRRRGGRARLVQGCIGGGPAPSRGRDRGEAEQRVAARHGRCGSAAGSPMPGGRACRHLRTKRRRRGSMAMAAPRAALLEETRLGRLVGGAAERGRRGGDVTGATEEVAGRVAVAGGAGRRIGRRRRAMRVRRVGVRR